MTSYGGQLARRDDHENILIINLLTSLTMPSVDITGDSNFVYILKSQVCVSSVNSSMTTKPSTLKASMTNRPPQCTMVDAPTLAYQYIPLWLPTLMIKLFIRWKRCSSLTWGRVMQLGWPPFCWSLVTYENHDPRIHTMQWPTVFLLYSEPDIDTSLTLRTTAKISLTMWLLLDLVDDFNNPIGSTSVS